MIKKVKKTTYTNYEILVISAHEKIEEVDIIIKPEETEFKSYNTASKKITGDYFIIIDEAILNIDRSTYVEELVGICQDETVGIVGTKLYNEENLVEHCGIILGMNGVRRLLIQRCTKRYTELICKD